MRRCKRLLLGPVEVLFLLASEQWLWMAAFAASAFLTLIHQGPLFALVMEVAPSRMRALAIATLVLFSGLLGQAAGPLIVGMANDALAPTIGDTAIRYSMLIIAATAILAGVMIMLSRRHLEHTRTGLIDRGNPLHNGLKCAAQAVRKRTQGRASEQVPDCALLRAHCNHHHHWRTTLAVSCPRAKSTEILHVGLPRLCSWNRALLHRQRRDRPDSLRPAPA